MMASFAYLDFSKELADLKKTYRFVTQVEEAKRHHEEEKLLPPKRVPPLSRKDLIRILSESRANNIKINGGPSIRSTYIGMPRTYSYKALCQLRRVSISEMYIRKTHEGRYLLCRIITPPTCIVSVLVGLEDPEGVAAQLALYNYPGMTDTNHDNLDKLLPIGTLLAIREPTYKFSINGNVPMIRVDAPSDIVFLPNDSSYVRNVSWFSDSEFPLERMKTSSIDEWLTRGRNEFQLQRWLTAAVFFSEGLKLDSAHSPLRINRALCYLRLGWYNAALVDAEEVRTSDGDHASSLRLKASFRSAKAQYMLGNYTQAINYLESFVDNDECKGLISKAKQRLAEQSTGQYDWTLLFKESRNKSARLDTANYTGSIEVTTYPKAGGGRGISVTRDVEIGELLLFEKPIASCYDSDFRDDILLFNAYDFLTNTMMKRTQVSLVHKVVERLWHDASLDQTLKSLYAGPSLSRPHAWKPSSSFAQSRTLKHPLEPVVDIDITRIEAVCSLNSFSAVQVTAGGSPSDLADTRKMSTAADATESHGHLIYGLASLFNHACQFNAHQYTLGDVIVIRATRPLKKGEEVTIPYIDPKRPFAHRTKFLSKWGFDCQCLLCTADRADGDTACAERALDEDDIPQEADININIKRIKIKIKTLENSYSKSSSLSSAFILKSNLLYAHSFLSLMYLKKAVLGGYPSPYMALCMKENMKVMELGGLVVLDKSISGPIAGPPTVQQGYMPIDTKNSQCFEQDRLVLNALQLASVFVFSLNDLVRGKGWMNVALWIHRIHVGGNKDLFQIMYEKDIEQLRLSNLIK